MDSMQWLAGYWASAHPFPIMAGASEETTTTTTTKEDDESGDTTTVVTPVIVTTPPPADTGSTTDERILACLEKIETQGQQIIECLERVEKLEAINTLLEEQEQEEAPTDDMTEIEVPSEAQPDVAAPDGVTERHGAGIFF